MQLQSRTTVPGIGPKPNEDQAWNDLWEFVINSMDKEEGYIEKDKFIRDGMEDFIVLKKPST